MLAVGTGVRRVDKRLSQHQAQERRELGGYSEAEFDAAYARTQRSDLMHIVSRVGTLLLAYGLLARAIIVHQLSAAFLLLPIALEWLLIMWLGLLLSRRFVHCPTFARSANRPRQVIVWTILIGLVVALVLAWDGATEAFSIARIPAEASAALVTVFETGLIWALLVGVVALGISTAAEVRRWRRVRGVFVWTSIIESGLRFASALVLGMISLFVLPIFGELLLPWLESAPQHRAWTVFGLLLAVELFAVFFGVVLHRDIKAGPSLPK